MNYFREMRTLPSISPTKQILPLSPESLARLLSAPDMNEPAGVRNRILLLLMTAYGLEVHQLHRLNVQDIDPQAARLEILSRRGKPRLVYLDANAVALLNRWLTIRRLYAHDPDAVFISLHWTSGRSLPGQRLSERGIRQVIDKHLAALGLKQAGVNCRSIRRQGNTKKLEQL